MATNPLESVAGRQYTLPEWARATGQRVDLRTSPYWSPQDAGDGSGTLGNGDGSGFYGALNGLDAAGATDWLNRTGQQVMSAQQGSEILRWLQDNQGNIAGAPEAISADDEKFGIGALLAGGVVGGAAAGMYGGGAAATEAGIGTLGTIAPGSAGLAPLATTGTLSTAPAITASIPQIGGAIGAVGAGAGAASQAGGAASTVASGAGGVGSLIGDAAKTAGGAMDLDWTDWAKIGATLIGSGIQSNAASNAVDAQAKSTEAAIAEQRRQFDLQRSDSAAYRDAGVNALSQFQTLVNTPTTAADVMQDPGYQFGMDQGQQQIDRKVAAMGGRVSGQAIKAAARFGTNYATTGYTAADQRRNDRLNRLAALAGIGQSATNASSSAGTAMANNISGLVTGQGNAAGGGILAQGNIWGNTANQLAALYGRGNQQPGSTMPTSPFANYGGDYNSLDYRP